jgi:quinol monooxygenase YgiN
MSVLMRAEIKGQTRQGYEGMISLLGERLKGAPGFILHTSHPTDDGWCVIEIWESKEALDQFFAKNVAPNLPAGIRPKLSIQELHSVLTR